MAVKERRIEEYFVQGKPLGRHVEHDDRSRGFGAVKVIQVPLFKVEHKKHGPVLDQSNLISQKIYLPGAPDELGSCTGNAAAGAINTAPLYKRWKRVLREPDAIKLYSRATVIDEWSGSFPPEDTGSSGLAVAKACVEAKHIKRYEHAFGIDEALTALGRTEVITGVNWYEGFDRPDANGVVKVAGQVRGGHEFVVTYFDPATQMVGGYNSWGPEWGMKGRFFFSVGTWSYLLSEEGDVTVLVR